MLYTIIGGSDQGKLIIASQKFHKTCNAAPIICDADLMSVDVNDIQELEVLFMSLLNHDIIDHLHLFIRKLSLNYDDNDYDSIVEKWLTKLRLKTELQVIILDDIGSGVVPLNTEDRKWRERCGRLYCRLNEISVYALRIWAGLPQVLKDVSQHTDNTSYGESTT